MDSKELKMQIIDAGKKAVSQLIKVAREDIINVINNYTKYQQNQKRLDLSEV